LGIHPDDGLSPGVLMKVVFAGVQASSFAQAEAEIKQLAELEISAQRIRRATERIGEERVAERQAAMRCWSGLTLPEQQASPTAQSPPVACVEADGGRMQIWDRPSRSARAREDAEHAGFWRETKVGCLLSMASQTHDVDPCPQLPPTFADSARMRQIAREIKGFCSAEAQEDKLETESGRPLFQPPEVLVKSVVATRRPLEEFGQHLAAEAHARGFAAALRKAFVGDGAHANWSLWQTRFSHYTPILDFVHALTYVYAAAMAGHDIGKGWKNYLVWAQWLWSGEVQLLLAALEARQLEIGKPPKDASETDPRQIVAETLRYVRNQQSRMRYADYRRQGLPITSSHIESTIKQINRRVKGSEKFWSSRGAEAMLQLAGDHLSDHQPLARFWQRRPNQATGHRHYPTAA
jgi:hypothetical protein